MLRSVGPPIYWLRTLANTRPCDTLPTDFTRWPCHIADQSVCSMHRTFALALRSIQNLANWIPPNLAPTAKGDRTSGISAGPRGGQHTASVAGATWTGSIPDRLPGPCAHLSTWFVIMTTQENELIHALSVEFIFAIKNYSSSQLAMFKNQAELTASRLIALGVSEECLNESWERHYK